MSSFWLVFIPFHSHDFFETSPIQMGHVHSHTIFLTQAKAPRPPKVGAGEAAHFSSFSPMKGVMDFYWVELCEIHWTPPCPDLERGIKPDSFFLSPNLWDWSASSHLNWQCNRVEATQKPSHIVRMPPFGIPRRMEKNKRTLSGSEYLSMLSEFRPTSAGWIRMVRWWHCWRQPTFWPWQMCRWLSGHLRLHNPKEKHTQYIARWNHGTGKGLWMIGGDERLVRYPICDILQTITPFIQTRESIGLWSMMSCIKYSVPPCSPPVWCP